MTLPDKHLDRLATAAGGWISAADAKAAALLGVSNILLGAVFLADLYPRVGEHSLLKWTFVGLVLTLHAVVAGCVLWPRTNRTKILKDAEFPSPLEASPSFFADIAQMKHAAYVTALSDEGFQTKDKEEQAFILAIIAHRKMSAYRWSIALFVACLAVFCALAAFSPAAAPSAASDEPCCASMVQPASATTDIEHTGMGGLETTTSGSAQLSTEVPGEDAPPERELQAPTEQGVK